MGLQYLSSEVLMINLKKDIWKLKMTYEIQFSSLSFCNFSDSTRDPSTIKQYEQVDVILLTIVMPIILAVGVIGNTAFLYVVVRISWMQTIPNKYLSNLAIADILLLLVAIGEKITRYVLSPYAYDEAILGYFGCIVIPVWKYCGYYASMLFVSLVTLERYFAVCRPLDRFITNTNRRSLQVIFLAWAISFVLGCTQIPSTCNMITYCVLWSLDDLQAQPNLPQSIGYCHPVNKLEWLEDMVILVEATVFFCSLICNVVLYVKIIRALNRRVAAPDCNNEGGGEQRIRVNHSISEQNHLEVQLHMRDRIARMLIINGTVFFLLMTPFQIIMLMKALNNKDPLLWEKEFGTWLHVCRVLTYLNSMVNPIIFNVTNPKYRRAFQKAFLCPKLKENNTSLQVIRPAPEHTWLICDTFSMLSVDSCWARGQL